MVSAIYTIAVLATFAVYANAATDYCTLRTCSGPNHTICKYGLNKFDRSQCDGGITSAGFTPTEIQDILSLHNSYRKNVSLGLEHRGSPGPQPAGTNLYKLTWDTELATIAQAWANQCHYGMDQCRDSERFKVGQNIGFTVFDAKHPTTYTDVVASWYEEVQHFDSNQVKSITTLANVAKYAMMMSGEARFLGCGGIRYGPEENYVTFLVCNYGPIRVLGQGAELYRTR